LNEPGYLFDTNVWIALTFQSHPLHAAANAIYARATADRKAYFCRSTQQSFLRLVCTPKFTAQYGSTALSNRDAFAELDGLMQRPNVGYLDEPKDLLLAWKGYADLTTASPKRWMDAYLAAFAVKAGLEFVSNDNAFKAFVGLALVPVS
jgi:uncharacterized protein